MARNKKEDQEHEAPAEETTAETAPAPAETAAPTAPDTVVVFASAKYNHPITVLRASVSALVEMGDGTTKLWAGGAEVHTTEGKAAVLAKLGW